MAASDPAVQRRLRSSGTAATKATMNQVLGGASSHETSAKAATPARLPARLIVYARSGGSAVISAAMRCASVAKSAATPTNSTGSSSVVSTAVTGSVVPLVK